MGLIGSGSTRPKRYITQVFAKVTVEQYVAVYERAQRQGLTVAEYVRGLIADALKIDDTADETGSLELALELLQVVRTEQVTLSKAVLKAVSSTVSFTAEELSEMSEGVAAADLRAFAGRSERRKAMVTNMEKTRV